MSIARSYFLNLTDKFARSYVLSASDLKTKFLICKLNFIKVEYLRWSEESAINLFKIFTGAYGRHKEFL